MKSIVIVYDPRRLDHRGIEKFITQRVKGRSLARWAMPAACVAFVAVSFFLSFLTRDAGTWLVWLLPCIAFFLMNDIVRNLAYRRFSAERDASPIRNRPSVSITLDETGVNADGTRIDWSEIIDVVQGPRVTLLMFLPDMGVPLPETALPEGVSADALLGQISEWRSV